MLSFAAKNCYFVTISFLQFCLTPISSCWSLLSASSNVRSLFQERALMANGSESWVTPLSSSSTVFHYQNSLSTALPSLCDSLKSSFPVLASFNTILNPFHRLQLPCVVLYADAKLRLPFSICNPHTAIAVSMIKSVLINGPDHISFTK